MIYLVTGQQQLFESDLYKVISIEESLQLLNSCKILQYDSETSGIDAHLGKILCIQFGNKEKDFQLVVDTTTIDILKYKDILEMCKIELKSKFLKIQLLFWLFYLSYSDIIIIVKGRLGRQPNGSNDNAEWRAAR